MSTTASTKLTTPMKGIDVSAHQQSINWKKVAADGIEFAIIRAGYGRYTYQKDKWFDTNYAGAVENGLHVGAYWYSYAYTAEDAEREAETFLECIKGKKFDMPLYFDFEEEDQLKLPKEQISKIIDAFLKKLEAAGYWAGLYMSGGYLNSSVTEFIKSRYAIWCAEWGNKTAPTIYKGSYGIWQHSAKGKVNGIDGDVDLDLCYGDYPVAIKANGLNGYTVEPVKKETIEITVTIAGEKYTGTLTKG